MTNIIRKIFIKDYNNVTDETVRLKHGLVASIFGIILNLFLFVIKLLIGLFSNSISIIADALNNLTDMGSSIISFIGIKLSSKPADKEHPYGHQRIEYITSFIISVIIIIVGFELLSTSISKIFNKDEVTYSFITLIVLFISILIKIYLSFFYKSIGSKINSLPLIASSKDSLNDVLSTLFILISAAVSIIFKINLDGIMGVVVSLFILYSGVMLAKETIDPLIGEKVDPKLIENILKEINDNEELIGYHDVMCHSYGPTKIFMSLHAEVDSSKNILFLHEVIDEIELSIKNKYGVELVIHMDPTNLSCDTTNYYKSEVEKILNNISTKLKFHDFRTVIGEYNTNLLFDVVIPFDLNIKKEHILEVLNCELKNDKVNLKLIVSFDNEFTH
ncbi:MAG: cation diffusion facilitator family transporter [bacterium]